jgi:hypothetical protein
VLRFIGVAPPLRAGAPGRERIAMLRAWREDHPPAALGKRSASPASRPRCPGAPDAINGFAVGHVTGRGGDGLAECESSSARMAKLVLSGSCGCTPNTCWANLR